MKKSNPVFQPVTQEDFFDREEQLQALLDGKQHIALIGPRKAGKTSLFQQFIEKQNAYVVVYYSVNFEETFDIFCQNYANAVISAYLRSQDKYVASLDETTKGTFTHVITLLASFRSDLRSFCSNLLSVNIREKDKGARLGILKLFLDIPYRLRSGNKNADLEIIVILDEFQNVTNFGGLVPDVLRQKIQEKSGVYYYVAGSEVGLMEEILHAHKAPLFLHLTSFRIEGFAYPDARQFTLYLCRESDLLLNEAVLNTLITLTNGFPFFIRVLVYQLKKIAEEKGSQFISRDDMQVVLEKSLYNQDGKLYQYFSETLDMHLRRKRSGLFVQILKTLAIRPLPLTELASTLNALTTTLPEYLTVLLQAELIGKNNEGYFIKNTLMRFWLAASVNPQQNPTLESKMALDTFHTKLAELLASIKAELGLAREAQIRETLVAEGPYKRVWGGRLFGQELDIISEMEHGYLFGEVKDKVVTAALVENFIAKVKKLKVNKRVAQKLLFVHLMGLELSARELLKKNDIEIWNLEKVNKVREKHKLPKITM